MPYISNRSLPFGHVLILILPIITEKQINDVCLAGFWPPVRRTSKQLLLCDASKAYTGLTRRYLGYQKWTRAHFSFDRVAPFCLTNDLNSRILDFDYNFNEFGVLQFDEIKMPRVGLLRQLSAQP